MLYYNSPGLRLQCGTEACSVGIIFKYSPFLPNRIQSRATFFLCLCNFNLVWRTVCAKKVQSVVWVLECSLRDGVLCLIGAKWCTHTHTQQWALGFDVLTRTTLKSHRKMMKEDKKIKSNDMIVFASTVMSQTFLLCTIKKILGFGGKKKQKYSSCNCCKSWKSP